MDLFTIFLSPGGNFRIVETMTATVEVGDVLQQDIINIKTLLSTLEQLLAVRFSELNNIVRCNV